ncbi:MAG: hypothetical protein R2860_15275 [Desulfobacterales bacterium]
MYLCYISKEEFVLYTTGGFTMGAEILVIFAFQIFFGYIYFQIGLIVCHGISGGPSARRPDCPAREKIGKTGDNSREGKFF